MQLLGCVCGALRVEDLRTPREDMATGKIPSVPLSMKPILCTSDELIAYLTVLVERLRLGRRNLTLMFHVSHVNSFDVSCLYMRMVGHKLAEANCLRPLAMAMAQLERTLIVM